MIRRGQGRPAENAVGRQGVLAVARRLLQTNPPARVTISLIAREAGVDPALIRYYFGDRSSLLLAVVNDILADAPRDEPEEGDAYSLLRKRVRHAHRFSLSAKHMRRLMMEELGESKSAEVRDRLRHINRQAVEAYQAMLEGNEDNKDFREVNPLFLYLLVVGVFDFFGLAEPIIQSVAPPGTDMAGISDEFEEFVTDVLMNGLARRE